jgi:hypothetical protein
MPSGLTAGLKGTVPGDVRGGPPRPGAVLLQVSSPEHKAVMR